jgi:hypothetical protein
MKAHYFYIAIVFLLKINTIAPAFADPSVSTTQKKTTKVIPATTAPSQIAGGKKITTVIPVKNVSSPAKNNATTVNPNTQQTTNRAGSPQKPLVLQGQIKHHKHPFKSLLKEEFDSPIHPITTDNKDF